MNSEEVKIEHFKTLIDLVDSGSETKIHRYLERHPFIWQAYLALNRTGHHGYKVLSRQAIVPHIPRIRHGMVPDFLIGGDSSDGWSYFVIELKSPSEQVFADTKGKSRFAAEANHGIVQVLGYLDFCSEYQALLRDLFELEGFPEPSGILLIDREKTYKHNVSHQRLKKAWNLTMPRLEVRTYDSLLRSLRRELEGRHELARLPIRDEEEEQQIELIGDVRNEIEFMRKQFTNDCYAVESE